MSDDDKPFAHDSSTEIVADVVLQARRFAILDEAAEKVKCAFTSLERAGFPRHQRAAFVERLGAQHRIGFGPHSRLAGYLLAIDDEKPDNDARARLAAIWDAVDNDGVDPMADADLKTRERYKTFISKARAKRLAAVSTFREQVAHFVEAGFSERDVVAWLLRETSENQMSTAPRKTAESSRVVGFDAFTLACLREYPAIASELMKSELEQLYATFVDSNESQNLMPGSPLPSDGNG